MLIDHLFFKMNFRKLILVLFRRTFKTYRKSGVLKEGVQKEHGYVNGKYVDNYILGFSIRLEKNGNR